MHYMTLSGSAFGGTGPFTGANSWAYRFVFVSEDANGYVRRSPPSSAYFGSDTAASNAIDWDVNGGRLYIPAWLAAGDRVEFYRTKMTGSLTGEPGTEFFLAFSYTLASADIAAGYFNPPNDITTDDALGAALYTNPSQQGIANAKEPPPLAGAVAFFQRCMWYGNTKSKHRIQVTLNDAGSSATTSTGIQYVTTTGDFTSGSADITGVASVTGMVVGGYITDSGSGPTVAGTKIKANTKIQAITGAGPYTITMTNTATATSAAASFTTGDVVTIATVEFYGFSLQTVPGVATVPQCFIVDSDAAATTRIATTAKYLEIAVNYHALANPSTFKVRATATGWDDAAFGSSGGSGEMFFESTNLGGTAFTLDSTRDAAWDANTPLTSDNDEAPHRLYWSEPDEPEAVPLPQFVDIGSQREPILALVPLRGALLVFKTDGVFRVSGTPPDGWTVDLLDSSVRIWRAECVDVLDNVAFTWTDRGVLAFDENGAQNISEGAIGRELAERAWWMRNGGDALAAWVTAWRSRNTVLVGVPESNGATYVQYVYAFNTVTRAWSRFTRSAYCMGATLLSMALARGGDFWEIRSDYTNASNTFTGYDRAYTGLTWTSDDTACEISDADRGAWTPTVGDWISCSVGGTVYYRRITAATDDGTSYTLEIESAFPAGAQSSRTAYEAIRSKIQWQAKGVVPTDTARLRRMHVVMDWTDYTGSIGGTTAEIVVGASTDRVATAATETLTETRSAKIAEMDLAPDRSIARAAYWMPYVEASDIGLEWRCLGVALDIDGVGERADR
jgi:hypothetical protein